MRIFSEAAVGCTASYFVKINDVHVDFVTPIPYFEAVYCFTCGRRRVAVARYRMICLVFLKFATLPYLLGLKYKYSIEYFNLIVPFSLNWNLFIRFLRKKSL